MTRRERQVLQQAREALSVTAGNIRSLGPAGAIPTPYQSWLKAVDDAVEALDALDRQASCLSESIA